MGKIKGTLEHLKFCQPRLRLVCRVFRCVCRLGRGMGSRAAPGTEGLGWGKLRPTGLAGGVHLQALACLLPLTVCV